jgi:polar amino acid transport system substrate-binding protein
MVRRVDLMIADVFLMSELLKKYPDYQGKVKAVSPPVLESSLHLLISKAHPDHATIVADFDRGLQEMRDDGTFDAIVERFGFREL